MDDEDRIATVRDVPTDGTLLVTLRRLDGETDGDDGGVGGAEGGEDREEAVLTRLDDGDVAAYVNRCQHFRHVRLDKGSGAEVRDGELVCTNHGAYFRADTGRCTYGPCEGAYLDEVAVAVADGADGEGSGSDDAGDRDDAGVYLADEDYEFVRVGGLGGDVVRSSRSNVEF